MQAIDFLKSYRNRSNWRVISSTDTTVNATNRLLGVSFNGTRTDFNNLFVNGQQVSDKDVRLLEMNSVEFAALKLSGISSGDTNTQILVNDVTPNVIYKWNSNEWVSDILTVKSSDLSVPSKKRSFKLTASIPIIASNSQTGQTVRYGEGNRQRLIIRNPVGSPGNLLVGYQPDPQNITQPNNPASFITVTPGNEIADFFSQGQWRVRSDQPTGSVPAGLIVDIEVETSL